MPRQRKRIISPHLRSWGCPDETYRAERKTAAVKSETKTALLTMLSALNQGQRKKMVKNAEVGALLDRYGVEYT